MTSKEALQRLRGFNNCDIHEPRMEEELVVIEKDLEVLQALNDLDLLPDIGIYDEIIWFKYDGSDLEGEEKINSINGQKLLKVKEWLENEKEN